MTRELGNQLAGSLTKGHSSRTIGLGAPICNALPILKPRNYSLASTVL